MNNAVHRLAEESGDNQLTLQFSVAEKFHINFYHNAVPNFQVENDRPNGARVYGPDVVVGRERGRVDSSAHFDGLKGRGVFQTDGVCG